VEQLHLGGQHTVVPVVRTPAALARTSRFELDWKIADALDAGALRLALQGCEVVVHAAAARGREIGRMPAALCTAAAAAGIRRIVWLSCASVHGPAPEPGTNEHSALHTDHVLPDTNLGIGAQAHKKAPLFGVSGQATDEVIAHSGQGIVAAQSLVQRVLRGSLGRARGRGNGETFQCARRNKGQHQRQKQRIPKGS